MLYSFFLYCLIGAHFSYASWAYIYIYIHIYIYIYIYICVYIYIYIYISMTPLSFCNFARIQEEKSLWTLEYLFVWWMDGMFCITLGVGVSMYMWVYVISIMEAWKDSTNGHNNLAKLNGSQASICKWFMHWYWHMALVGNVTIEELALFYFQQGVVRDFTILWDRADQHCLTISY
jgi:hypothetical protein